MTANTHVLLRMSIRKDIFNWNVHLAHVILAKSILVPADDFDKRNPYERQIEMSIPFGIEILADRGSGLFGVTERNDQVLFVSV